MIEYSDKIGLSFVKNGEKFQEFRAGIIIDGLIGVHQINDEDEGYTFFELIAINSGRKICTIDFIDHAILCANALIGNQVAIIWINQTSDYMTVPVESDKDEIKAIIRIYQDMDSNRCKPYENIKSNKIINAKSKINDLLSELKIELHDLLCE